MKSNIVVSTLLLAVLSCQEPAEEITFAEDEVFTKTSELGEFVRRISLNDGSADNIIDNASCLTVVLPVSGTFQGMAFRVETPADITVLQDAFHKNPYQQNLFIPDFPLRVVNANHTEVAVSNRQELEALASMCIENGLDDDIECVDFDYPVTIYNYHLANQQPNTHVVADDEAMHNLLAGLDDNDILSFRFPLSLATSAGTIQIGDQLSLQDAIEGEDGQCDENDRKYYPELPLITQKFTLLLTDAPFPLSLIDEANVTISKIEVKTGEANDSIPFVTLLEEPVTLNLLELTNGVTATLSETELPVGSYSFFRLFVTDASLKMADGEVFEVKVPGGSTSGIKIITKNPITVEEDAEAEYLLDFDVSRSFVLQGNPDTPAGIRGFIFKPVIRASSLLASGTLAGTVTTTTGVPLEGAQVSVFAADTLHTTGFSNGEGQFAFPGLEPGSYSVYGELDGFEPSDTKEIIIESAKETTINLELTES